MTIAPPTDAAASGWARTDAALDELIALPAAQRGAAITRIAGADAGFALELQSLAAQLDGDDELLDRPAADMLSGMAAAPGAPAAPPSLTPGTRLGPWRIDTLLGRGGMGEVYRAARADGQFEQQVAIKLMRLDAVTQAARFRAERQIVARLDHPGIARLLDGDVSADGRPYMVMELVVGRHLIDWCAANAPTLAQRLALFIEVCDAVAYAHRNLVVHRDLKPANVLVTAEGRVKLLDFGIARLLDAPSGEATQELLLTPGYASPEQLSGGAITTAADVHALGLLLHELLCGAPAYAVGKLPLAAAMQQVITQGALAPSRVARELPSPPVPPAQLTGDLDAIVAKALRKEPEQRYATVDEMRADVERYRRHEPVLARRGNWRYVAGRALRRHRGWAIGFGVALLAVAAGTTAVAWQARVAHEEAERATAVKNFLLQVFKASDPRVASDKPRGQATARELLDVGAGRIERDFKAQPALQIELLGTVADLYRELSEPERYLALQKRRVALANQYPGRFPQAAIEALLDAAGDDLTEPNRVKAREHLAQADALIRRAALDASLLRARWWLTSGQALESNQLESRRAAFDRALALFERHGPHDAGRITALTERGLVFYDLGDNDAAVRSYREALAAEELTDNRDDGEAQTIWGNLGQAYLNLGRYGEAESALKQAAELAQRTYGEQHSDYWVPASIHARLLHLNGQRDDAMRRFEALQHLMPDPPTNRDGWEALTTYAERLAAQGQAGKAVKRQEAAEQFFRTHLHAPNSLRRAHLILGDMYEQLGRDADARRLLKAAFDAYAESEPPERQTRMAATERWGRLLVSQGDASIAHRLFEEVLAQDHDRHLAHAALAQAGLARVALAEGNASEARTASAAAMKRWSDVRGFRDVRMGAYITRVHASALLAAGDAEGARAAAESALADSARFDAPEAASISEARALIARALAGH